LTGIALALGASISWGISDFLGGLQSRRFSAFSVLLFSQPVGAVLAYLVVLVAADESLPAEEFAAAAVGGAAVLLGLGAFYRGMALGSISIVATVGALGVLVPIVAGLIRGENPSAIQAVGAAIAIGAVVLVSREPDPEWREANRAAIGFGAIAALGFGVFLLLVDRAAETDPVWAVAAARTGGVALLGVAAIAARPQVPHARGAVLLALLAIASFDILANTLFAFASTEGILPLVSVAASLYAAVTVLLARVFLDERLASSQRLGVVLALAGVAMIAAGSA
jgi:drug/metabolite transporter (DMT)-like permease